MRRKPLGKPPAVRVGRHAVAVVAICILTTACGCEHSSGGRIPDSGADAGPQLDGTGPECLAVASDGTRLFFQRQNPRPYKQCYCRVESTHIEERTQDSGVAVLADSDPCTCTVWLSWRPRTFRFRQDTIWSTPFVTEDNGSPIRMSCGPSIRP